MQGSIRLNYWCSSVVNCPFAYTGLEMPQNSQHRGVWKHCCYMEVVPFDGWGNWGQTICDSTCPHYLILMHAAVVSPLSLVTPQTHERSDLHKVIWGPQRGMKGWRQMMEGGQKTDRHTERERRQKTWRDREMAAYENHFLLWLGNSR